MILAILYPKRKCLKGENNLCNTCDEFKYVNGFLDLIAYICAKYRFRIQITYIKMYLLS